MISSNKPHATDIARTPIKSAKPNIISSAHNKMAMLSANPFKKAVWKTSKYSSSLYEKPSGSFALIQPEKIKSSPTSILAAQTHHAIFILFFMLLLKVVKVVVVEKVNQF